MNKVLFYLKKKNYYYYYFIIIVITITIIIIIFNTNAKRIASLLVFSVVEIKIKF